MVRFYIKIDSNSEKHHFKVNFITGQENAFKGALNSSLIETHTRQPGIIKVNL